MTDASADLTGKPLPPVEGRNCGECTACCQYLLIDVPELQKLPGILCAHHNGALCRIYEDRPTPCRDYLCGWRLFPFFDDSWRPDRCGILITVRNHGIPKGYMQEALEMQIYNPQKAFQQKELLSFLFRAVKTRVPVYIHLRGPIGTAPAGRFINGELESVVEAGDEESFLRIIDEIVLALSQGPFHTVTIKNREHPSSS